MWPFRAHEKEMALSVIAPKHAIEQVFPPERCDELNIFIKTNTAPALVGLPIVYSAHERIPKKTLKKKPLERNGIKFPYYKLTEADLKAEKPQVVNAKLDDLIQEIKGRPRSDTIEKVRNAPKVPNSTWQSFSSAPRTDQPHPDWDSTTAPFTRHPTFNDDAWWQEDHAKRVALLAQWSKDMVEVEKMNARAQWDGDDIRSGVAGVHFPVVPPLCDTYTADRSDKWYRDNVEAAELRDQQREYAAAQQNYQAVFKEVRQFYDAYKAMHVEARTQGSNQRLISQMQAAKTAQRNMLDLMQSAEQQLFIAAKECGFKIDPSKMNVIGQMETKMWQEVNKAANEYKRAPQRAQQSRRVLSRNTRTTPPKMPNTPMPQHMHMNMAGAAHNEDDDYDTEPDEPGVAEALVATHRPANRNESAAPPPLPVVNARSDVVPFPAYRDPMLARARDVAATQQNIRIAAARSRGRTQRVNTAQTIAGMIAETNKKLCIEEPRSDSVQPQPVSDRLPKPQKADVAGALDGKTYCTGPNGPLASDKTSDEQRTNEESSEPSQAATTEKASVGVADVALAA